MGYFFCGQELKAQDSLLVKAGTYTLGVNYWASHAGTNMWQEWNAEVVEKDFKQLSENGIKVLRIFPLWPDFQPIYRIYTAMGTPKYIAYKNGQPLPPNSDGMSEEQLKNFETLSKIASKYDLKLMVALITGWMSGRLFVPPALEGKDILTDPESLMWQKKFVTTFVKKFKNNPSIIAWNFGNECNVMQELTNHHQAYVWLSVLSGAIRSEDRTRPLVSGMHSLKVEDSAPWRIIDQIDHVDVFTTHPYSLFTPYAGQEEINSMRPILHSTAETRLYADISGKPALVEEIGVLGQMVAGENEKAAFARTGLFSNWAHDCKGTFWWCAYDQTLLNHPPYNYSQLESNLGLIKEDRTVKPVMKEFKLFDDFLKRLPFKTLPSFKKDAVCLLTDGQDNWGIAYSTFILAKQAGFDIQFQKMNQELKDAKLYLMPSVTDFNSFTKDDWKKVLAKVNEGSTLYVSLNNTYLTNFIEPLGIEVLTNSVRQGSLNMVSDSVAGINFNTTAERKIIIRPVRANVIAKEEENDNPVFLCTDYGKGKIYLLMFPLENSVLTVGSFSGNAPAYSNIYKYFAASAIGERVLHQSNTSVGVTEHEIDKNKKIVVLINYNSPDVFTELTLKNGWRIGKVYYGNKPDSGKLTIKGNDAVVMEVIR